MVRRRRVELENQIMPGSLTLASPTTVMPKSLCAAFSEQREFPLRSSGPYVDGSSQRATLATVGRRSWSLSKRLTFTEWQALETFWEACKGPLTPFYWYPLASQHDDTGVATNGRFTVRFVGSLSRNYAPGRLEVSLGLIQVS